jgi:phage baseplate assembly protein W
MSIYRGFSTVANKFGPFLITDQKLIVQNFLNQLNIRKGEIPHRSKVGCVIWQLLFSPFTNAVQNEIVTDVRRIIKMDPRLSSASTVSATSVQSGIILNVTLAFTNTNQTTNMELLFDSATGTAIIK